MREALKARNGCRIKCRARIERFGSKRAYKGPDIVTLLLRNVICIKTGELLTDHLWFKAGKWSKPLLAGDEIEFEARATPYMKGYRGRREDAWDAPPIEEDWRLERPTKVRKIGATVEAGSLFAAKDCPSVAARL
jgi:hypothetical protein